MAWRRRRNNARRCAMRDARCAMCDEGVETRRDAGVETRRDDGVETRCDDARRRAMRDDGVETRRDDARRWRRDAPRRCATMA